MNNRIDPIKNFRMYAGIRFNRPIDISKDFISAGAYEVVSDEESVKFDFYESYADVDKHTPTILHVEQRNPMWEEYPKLARVHRDFFKNIKKIEDFFVYTGEAEETDLKPIGLVYVHFLFPYDKWECVAVKNSVLKNTHIGSSGV